MHDLRKDTYLSKKILVKHLKIKRAKAVIINTDAGLINVYHLCILIHEFANIPLLREIYLTCGNNPCVFWVKSFFWGGGGGGCSATFYQ